MIQQNEQKPHMVGINHVALEVADIEAALAFYGSIFSFSLRGRDVGMAFIDMGDQFLALAETDDTMQDRHRHFGLVVDDRSGLCAKLKNMGIELLPGMGLNFRDPWGNFIQVVEYRDIQFTKIKTVLQGMGLTLDKSDEALEQLRKKGMV